MTQKLVFQKEEVIIVCISLQGPGQIWLENVVLGVGKQDGKKSFFEQLKHQLEVLAVFSPGTGAGCRPPEDELFVQQTGALEPPTGPTQGGRIPLVWLCQNKRRMHVHCTHILSSGTAYLDVLDPLLDLLGSEVVVGHQLLALFDGLLQVGGSPGHLVFKGFVLTQQSHDAGEVLPVIL